MQPNRRIIRRTACLLFLAVLVGVPCRLIYRQVRQERLDRTLVEAIKSKDTAAVRAALNNGASPNARDDRQEPESIWQHFLALLHGRQQPSEVEGEPALLLVINPVLKGMNPNSLSDEDLNTAATIIGLLLDNGADPNITDFGQNTVLQMACLYGMEGTVRKLLAHGAKVNSKDINGSTPLKLALGHPKVVHRLLERGANPNERFMYREVYGIPLTHPDCTPLIATAFCCDFETAKVLLAGGADVNARDASGKTALKHALEYQAPARFIKLLKQAGAKE